MTTVTPACDGLGRGKRATFTDEFALSALEFPPMDITDLFLLLLQLAVYLFTEAVELFERFWKRAFAPAITSIKRSMKESLRTLRAGAWAVAPGAVESIVVDELFTEWKVEIAYSYRVEAERYSGFASLPYGRYDDTEKYRLFLKPGSPLTVRYHPRHVETSLLLFAEQQSFAIHAASYR